MRIIKTFYAKNEMVITAYQLKPDEVIASKNGLDIFGDIYLSDGWGIPCLSADEANNWDNKYREDNG